MNDSRRLAVTAVVLLVVLRISIGWQFLYEGLWKIDKLETPKPWTAAGYLKNSQGPFRNTFREMAGDPDELGWLDYDTVASRWDDWHKRFASHYQLDEKQTQALDKLMNGAHAVVDKKKVYIAALNKLPSGVEKLNVSQKVAWFNAKRKRLYVDATYHLKPDEKAKLDSLVKGRNDAEAAAFRKAVQRVYDLQKRGLGFKEKLAGAIKGDPNLVGNVDWQRVGKLEEYKRRLVRHEEKLAAAETAFQFDHLQHDWQKIQTLRAELTGPVKALESELNEKAAGLLTLEQQTRGPVPESWTSSTLATSNMLTIVGLTILGVMLIVGLGTRLAAVAGAFMLFNFYLVMPPWPGVPPAPGPEHSFIINKNLIEVFALVAIAAMPTGTWFGLDSLVRRYCAGCCRKNGTSTAAASESKSSSTETDATTDSAESAGQPQETSPASQSSS